MFQERIDVQRDGIDDVVRHVAVRVEQWQLRACQQQRIGTATSKTISDTVNRVAGGGRDHAARELILDNCIDRGLVGSIGPQDTGHARRLKTRVDELLASGETCCQYADASHSASLQKVSGRIEDVNTWKVRTGGNRCKHPVRGHGRERRQARTAGRKFAMAPASRSTIAGHSSFKAIRNNGAKSSVTTRLSGVERGPRKASPCSFSNR